MDKKVVGEIKIVLSGETCYYESTADLVADFKRYIEYMGVMGVEAKGYADDAKHLISEILLDEFGGRELTDDEKVGRYIIV